MYGSYCKKKTGTNPNEYNVVDFGRRGYKGYNAASWNYNWHGHNALQTAPVIESEK